MEHHPARFLSWRDAAILMAGGTASVYAPKAWEASLELAADDLAPGTVA